MQWFNTTSYSQGLAAPSWRAASDPVVLASTPSTNDVARNLMTRGAPPGTVVVAREQRVGRGRLERQWASPPGGLWFSLVLWPDWDKERPGVLPLTIAVAMAEGLAKSVRNISVGLKWPNDLMVDEKKLGGILMERSGDGLVVGVGVNVNQSSFAPPLDRLATSLFKVTGETFSLERVLACAVNCIYLRYLEWEKDGGQGTLEAWRRLTITLKRRVRVSLPTGTVEGRAVDVDGDGSLLVETADGLSRILAGDVTLLRPV